MAGEIKKDSQFDLDLAQMKVRAETLKKDITIFISTCSSLKSKERADFIRRIQDSKRALNEFLIWAINQDTVNTGTKYALDTLRQANISIGGQWRKIERMLDDGKLGGGAFTSGSTPGGRSLNATNLEKKLDNAVTTYLELNQKLGFNVGQSQLDGFRTQLKTAMEQTKKSSGHQDLDVNITSEAGKIKVNFKPKN